MGWVCFKIRCSLWGQQWELIWDTFHVETPGLTPWCQEKTSQVQWAESWLNIIFSHLPRRKAATHLLWNTIQRGFPAGWGQFCSPWWRKSRVSVVTKLFYSLDNPVHEPLRAEGISPACGTWQVLSVPGTRIMFEPLLFMLLSVWWAWRLNHCKPALNY